MKRACSSNSMLDDTLDKSDTKRRSGVGIIRDEEMRHDSPGLGLDDAMNGYSLVQGRFETYI